MIKPPSAFLYLFVATTSSAQAQNLTIDHRPVACAAAEKFPRLEAGFDPADAVAVARVVFRGETEDWYSVAMKPAGAVYAGVLPKPRKDLKSFRYYIEVTDKLLGTNRTEDYTATVVDSASDCQGKLMASAIGSASVILQGPAGVVALPPGFASAGVVAGSAAGSSASAAGATEAFSAGAGGGGGVGATALVVGGIAVAGGAAAVVAAKASGESGSGSGGGDSGGSNRTVYGVLFLPSPPGIDVSVCAGRTLTWSSQNVSADTNGNFNETWAPNEPNTARISGSVSSTSFQATVSCTNGARSGTISAGGSGNSFSGTFAFGSSTGQVTITKQP